MLGLGVAAQDANWQVLSLRSLTGVPAKTLLRDRPQVLMFFQPECRFCKTQALAMQRIQAACAEVSFELIGVHAGSAELARELKRYQITLPGWQASDRFLRQIGDIQTTPQTWVVLPEGGVVAKTRGMVVEATLKKLTSQLAPACDLSAL